MTETKDSYHDATIELGSNKPASSAEHIESSDIHDGDMVITDVKGSDGDFKLSFGMIMALLSFQLGYFSDTFVVVMASSALTDINRSLGPSTSYSWIATSLTLGGAALGPVAGRLGDIFGRRIYLMIGNVISLIGAIICATGHSIPALIGGGSLIGIAASMRQMAYACMGELVPKRSRGLAFAFLQQTLSLAQAFGPIMAFGFIGNGSWRPVYWLPFALDCTALVLVAFFYHPMNQYIREEGKSRFDQVKESDWIGMFLFIAGIVLLLMGISFGGTKYPWKSAGTIAPIVIGFLCLIACGLYEAYASPKYAIFPAQMFKNIRGLTVLLVAVFVLGMLYYSIAVLWPIQVQTLYATDPIHIGWYSSVGGLAAFLACPLIGYAQKYLQNSRWQLLFYTVLMTIFSACLATSTPKTNVSSPVLVGLTFICVSAVNILATSMAQVGVHHAHIGVASGLTITSRSLGGAVATTIYLSILNNRVAANIPKDVAVPLAQKGVALKLIPAVIEALTSGETTSPALAQVSPQALETAIYGLKLSYASAFRLIYMVTIAFGVIGVVLVAFAADVDHLMTDHIDIKLNEGAHIRAVTDTGEGHILKRVHHVEKAAKSEE